MLEGQGGDSRMRKSPGGFEFGIQGWTWGDPIPRSITFFLDNTAMVCDQYGRCIRRALSPEGVELRFADTAPPASREGDIQPRPQFATHMQTLVALQAERVNWLAYDVKWVAKDGTHQIRGGVTQEEANRIRQRLINEGCGSVTVDRTIACAGWPQLPYAELKKIPELPPTPEDELRKIRDPQLRKDALKMRRELDSVRVAELAAAEAD